MPLPENDPRLSNLQARIDAVLKVILDEIFLRLQAGESPDDVLQWAAEEAYARLKEETAAALGILTVGSPLPPSALAGYAYAGVPLSRRLYWSAEQVSHDAGNLIRAHTKGLHQATRLALGLFEGYDFNEAEILKVKKALPKYLQRPFASLRVASLRTPYLRAAYAETLRKRFSEASRSEIERSLKVAWYERNRYFAGRIARTELARVVNYRDAREIMADAEVQVVQIVMSRKHPKMDICDLHSTVNLYGLGPGMYPKAQAPIPPFHPHCYCHPAPRFSVDASKAKLRVGADRAFVRRHKEKDRAAIMGSKAKANEFVSGAGLDAVLNEGKNRAYWLKRAKDV